ncbi:hypothetical protein [Nitrosopumilus sp.]|nr:hypothetical protein [Nitrosopumilus sp.]
MQEYLDVVYYFLEQKTCSLVLRLNQFRNTNSPRFAKNLLEELK